MATLLIRKLDDDLKRRLRERAALRGRSMEEEARKILQEAVGTSPAHQGRHLLEIIREEFGPLGGVELDMPPRAGDWTPPRFDE